MLDFDDLPLPIEKSKEIEIIDRIKNKCHSPTDRDDLINGNLRFAFAIAWTVLKRAKLYPTSRCAPDVFQTSLLTLINCVDDLFNKEDIDYEYKKYLNKTISWRCQDTIRKDYDVRIFGTPMRTIRYNLNNGMNHKHQVIEEIKDIDQKARDIIALLPPIYQAEMKELAKTLTLKDLKVAVKRKIYELLTKTRVLVEDAIPIAIDKNKEVPLELKEILERSTHTLRERDIINYRAQGMTYDEIGKMYSMSAVAVFHYIEKVRNRFDELWDQ